MRDLDLGFGLGRAPFLGFVILVDGAAYACGVQLVDAPPEPPPRRVQGIVTQRVLMSDQCGFDTGRRAGRQREVSPHRLDVPQEWTLGGFTTGTYLPTYLGTLGTYATKSTKHVRSSHARTQTQTHTSGGYSAGHATPPLQGLA